MTLCARVTGHKTRAREDANLSDLFVMFIERFAVFPVEERGDAHDFFLLVDDGQRQDVFDDKTRLIHSLFLKDTAMRFIRFMLFALMCVNHPSTKRGKSPTPGK